MAPRAGLFLHEQQLTLVAITGRRQIEHVSFELDDNPSALLKAELDARRIKLRGLRLGLQRSLITVKVLELPPAVGGNLREMVGFELERHVPFPPEDIAFDFLALPSREDAPVRILVAACERRTIERSLRLLEAPRLKPLALTVACHDLPGLLRRGVKPRRVVWAHRGGAATDLLFLGGGRLRLSRSVPVEDGDELAAEIQRSLSLLGWPDCEALWMSGDEPERFRSSRGLGDLGAPVSEPPYSSRAAARIAALPVEEHGLGLLALAVATGSRRPVLNLLPERLRPQTFSAGQLVTAATVVTAALLGIALLLAQGHREQRYLDELTMAIRGLTPEVKAVEGLAAELGQKRRLLQNLESIGESGIRPLPLLHELTELVPQDAWVNTLTMDPKGVEIVGQANAANQLIPLLESSPWLERVEFTSPVTKGRDKEQFRIKAAWEPGTSRRLSGPPPAPDRGTRTPEGAALAPGRGVPAPGPGAPTPGPGSPGAGTASPTRGRGSPTPAPAIDPPAPQLPPMAPRPSADRPPSRPGASEPSEG